MEMTFSVGDLSSLIQAIISCLTLVVGVVTIIILVGYVKGGVKPGQCGGVKVGQSIVGGCCGIAG
jgi:hypothetical protein